MSKDRFVTGIYNYCDYWCQRCAFTRRCRNFAMEEDSVERSVAAWLSLRQALPQREDDILRALALLDRLRRGVNAVLPGAAAFRRPGFDGEANLTLP